jgi:hypothetical protein
MNIQTLKDLLAENGGVLHSGPHNKGDCKVCVRELRCLALGLPEWTDLPDGDSPTDSACQVLNDACWMSDQDRTDACLPLALLTESEAPAGWVDQYILRTIREILPTALRAAGLEDHAVACESAKDLDAARKAAKDLDAARKAAKDAAFAAKDAAFAAKDAALAADSTAMAAYYAAYAARYSARASKDPDAVLRKAVQILIECHTGPLPTCN